jgi:hypothetical protein
MKAGERGAPQARRPAGGEPPGAAERPSPAGAGVQSRRDGMTPSEAKGSSEAGMKAWELLYLAFPYAIWFA